MVFLKAGTQKCARSEFSGCPCASPSGPVWWGLLGFTTAREPKRWSSKTPLKFNGKTPKRVKKERNFRRERAKKSAKFCAVQAKGPAKNLEHTHHTHTHKQQPPTSTTNRHQQAPTGTNTNKHQQAPTNNNQEQQQQQQGFRPSKTPPEFNEKTPRETQKERNGGGKGKKKSKIHNKTTNNNNNNNGHQKQNLASTPKLAKVCWPKSA